MTFLEALNFRDGNTIQAAVQILLRQAVAAYLNAENPSVSYPRSVTEVVDADNNLQCPLRDAKSDILSADSIKACKDAAKAAKNAAKAAKKATKAKK